MNSWWQAPAPQKHALRSCYVHWPVPRCMRGDKRPTRGGTMSAFLRALEEQRWDDHRYYHHSYINQTLHVVSAVSFLCAYALLFTQPATAALVGWLVAMISRQSGHFFFEPKGYDEVNDVTHEYKEAVKVGYNLHRKIVLLAIWALTPLVLFIDPNLFGLFAPNSGFVHNLAVVWLALGGAALLFRVAQLWITQDAMTGLVWMTKILTDPFHDIKLYYRAPLHLLRGELIDPMGPKVRY
jgi:hypothetical protein